MIKIDKKDKDILYSLDFNARDSFSSLAKKVKISKEALLYRIKRLEREEVITGYFIIPNTPKLGLVSYKILLKYQNLPIDKEKAMLHFLEKSKEVGWIIKTEGSYDMMFIIWTENEITFDIFWTNFLNKYSRYFYEKETLILIENHACRKEYLSNNKQTIKEVSYRGETKNECDKIDAKIIYELSKNSRISALDLSKKIKITPEAIGYRIKQLIKKDIVQAFRPKINLEKIGYSFFNVLIRVKDFSKIPEMFSYFKNNKNITYYVRYLGKYDLGLDIETDSNESFRKILEKIRVLFGDSIINYDFARIIDEIKITYGFPEI